MVYTRAGRHARGSFLAYIDGIGDPFYQKFSFVVGGDATKNFHLR